MDRNDEGRKEKNANSTIEQGQKRLGGANANVYIQEEGLRTIGNMGVADGSPVAGVGAAGMRGVDKVKKATFSAGGLVSVSRTS